MGKKLSVQSLGESSRVAELSTLWHSLWALNVPSVVKVFLWKACHNLLPTKANLFKKKVTSDPLCLICEVEEETICHILWGCPSSSDEWGVCLKNIQKCFSGGSDFIQVLEELMHKLDKEDFELLVTVARRLWLRRNTNAFGGDLIHPDVLVKQATNA